MNTSLTKFCKDYNLPKSSVYRRCQELNIDSKDGLTPEACDQLLHEFDVTPAQPEPEPEQPSVTVEVGNHCTSLALPELPQAYSLEVLRTSEVVSFEDPLAVAAQFLQAAEGLTTAMQSDIEKRQQRLNQTRQAKDEIAAKAQSLQLESRLYQLQTQQLDAATSAETSKLTRSLQQLKALGKQAAG